MSGAITTIGLSGVNCYLLTAGDGFVLVDTGLSSKRAKLERRLALAGCTPGRLKLILLTHGDIDHVGNAAYLREAYGAKIAMHADDAGMAETGDADLGRKPRPDHVAMTGRFIRVAGTLAELMRRGTGLTTFTPDELAADGDELGAYGLDARVLHLPGHSPGSIGVLTAAGELICGDLLYNWRRPSVPICDDAAAFRASMAKLGGLHVATIYPGHGKPFAWSALGADGGRGLVGGRGTRGRGTKERGRPM
jgi:hydroxyacylglutathione hydrolase